MDEQMRDRLRELFSGKVDIVSTDGDGVRLIHHLREPTAEEDMIFRKRSTAIRFVGNRAVPADEAFRAPILFYETICEGVSAEIDGEKENIDDFQTKIPADLKVAIISAFQNRFKVGEREKVKPNGVVE